MLPRKGERSVCRETNMQGAASWTIRLEMLRIRRKFPMNAGFCRWGVGDAAPYEVKTM